MPCQWNDAPGPTFYHQHFRRIPCFSFDFAMIATWLKYHRHHHHRHHNDHHYHHDHNHRDHQALLQLQGNLLKKEKVLGQVIEEREQVDIFFILTILVIILVVILVVIIFLVVRRLRSNSEWSDVCCEEAETPISNLLRLPASRKHQDDGHRDDDDGHDDDCHGDLSDIHARQLPEDQLFMHQGRGSRIIYIINHTYVHPDRDDDDDDDDDDGTWV